MTLRPTLFAGSHIQPMVKPAMLLKGVVCEKIKGGINPRPRFLLRDPLVLGANAEGR